MVKSMTGFGRGTAEFGNGKVVVEVKTVNHKYFDATLKLPGGLIALEEKIKEALQKKIMRGKVYLNLSHEGGLLKDHRVSINQNVAKDYYRELSRLKKFLGLADTIAVKDLVMLPGVLNCDTGEESLLRVWPVVKRAVEKALERLIADRAKEGRALCADLTFRAKRISKMTDIIKSRSHINKDDYRRRFAERIKDLTGGRNIDMGRLEMEVAIFAKNCDISEEITRLKNHLENFIKTIAGGHEVGKKLDFIAQELHREANTIGSKASDFKISNNVIEIKSEIEKIREQAKNLE
ncbi:MAG: YicC family protein [Candidatus Omnitrophica bacterium]|nr:YicC family protein [Candidatus Omnitrophota bacterium]